MQWPDGKHRGVAILAAGLPLIGFYLFLSLGLSRQIDVTVFPSGIYDLDVDRIVTTWTSPAFGMRTEVHPLQKLAIAPLGIPLRRLAARFFSAPKGWYRPTGKRLAPWQLRRRGFTPQGLLVARVLIAFFMTATVLLTGWLTLQLTGGGLVPALLAIALCAFSFSSMLLGAIPDSASISGLGTLAPLLYLNHRFDRRFGWAEVFAWAFLGVFCIAFTITQVMHWLIALGTRAFLALRSRRDVPPRRTIARLSLRVAVLALLFVSLTWGGLILQSRVYPGTWMHVDNLEREQKFLRAGELEQTPVTQITRLAIHFLGYDFAAPYPTYSSFLSWMLGYWSLSLEEVRLRNWQWFLWPIAAFLIVAIAAAAAGLRRADRRFLAPVLCIGGQFALHLLYGREYVLYSPNWHGVVVAVLVASCWNAFIRHRRALSYAFVVLALALLANNLAVLNRTYREVEGGLWLGNRDADGRLLEK